MPMESTSASLLEQLRQRGTDAWARFVHLYTPVLFRWADRIRVPPADRHDLVQEIFLAVFRALPEFRYDPSQSFRGWLYTVAVNKWRELSRKRSPAAGLPGAIESLAGPDTTAAVDAADDAAVLVSRAAELIQGEFAATTWKAFWATAVEGRPAATVAAELGVSLNAVYLARSRVLARLRFELAGLVD
jgi:RNA polymerase sigma-70 factor, ECF subfamily